MEFVKPPKDLEGFSKSQENFSPDPFRSLSQLKKSLENYKNLCERRILEIYPDHPIPVKEEHLGLPIPYLNELQLAKQKISKMEKQLESTFEQEELNESLELKYNKVIKDKLSLEESLRAEILNSEEQRAYIEILKQALEDNLEENKKKSENIPKDTPKDQPKTQNLDSRRDVANLKNQVKDLESQLERSKSSTKSKESELKIIFNEKQQLASKLKELSENLQNSQEENLKLEEEKSSLLDYIDEHSQKEAEMEKNIKDLGSLLEEMKENYSETMEKLESEMKKNKQNTEELKIVHEELDKANKMIREMQKTNAGLKEKWQESQNLCKTVKDEKRDFEIKCESLIGSNSTLVQTLKETQTEVERQADILEKLKKTLSEQEEIIFGLKSEAMSRNQEISALKGANHELEMEKIMKNDEKNAVTKELVQEKQRTLNLTSKVSDSELKIRSMDHDIAQKAQSEQQLRSELSKLLQYKSDFDRLKAEYVELQNREKTQASIIQELREINNERSQETDALYQESQKIILEKEELHRELEDFDKIVIENKFLQQLLQEEKQTMEYFKEVLNNDKAMIENRMKVLQDNEFKSNELVDFLQKQLKDEEKVNVSLKKELNEVVFKMQNMETGYLNERNRIVACIRNVIDIIPTNHSPFSSIFSQAFKDTLLGFHNNPSPDVHDICSFSEQAADHIKFLFDINFDLHDEINKKNYEISLKTSKIDSLTSELDHQSLNFSQLSQQLQKLSLENSDLKLEIQKFSQENWDLKDTLNRSFSNLQSMKMNNVYIENNLKTLEHENKFLKTEKSELQNLLGTKKGFGRENNLYNLIEALEREKLDIQCKLMKCDSDAKNINNSRELRKQLLEHEKQIIDYKKSLSLNSRAETPLRFKGSFSSYTPNKFTDETPPRRNPTMFK